MQKLLRLVVALSLVVACSGGAPPLDAAESALSANAARRITILHVNDTHSTLDSIGPKDANLDGTLGGLSRAATVIERIRRGTPNTLFLHAGDFFEGDLAFPATSGVVELKLLEQLGIDAMTVGNHDLHYGPDLLVGSLTSAGFAGVPLLSANLEPPAEPHPLSSFVTNHVVREVNGVRVGIFGLTTDDDPLTQPAPFAIGARATIAARAAAEVEALRAEHADVVILLSHLSSDLDHELAATPDNGIDFIIGGHDEFDETFAEYTGGTQVVRASHFYQRVGKLDIVFQRHHGEGTILAATHQLIPIDATTERHPDVVAAVQPLKGAINESLGFDAFNTQVAIATEQLENEWQPAMGPRRDYGVGDLAADALAARFEGSIGLVTSGLLSDRIYAGPIVANDLFRAMPYGMNLKWFGDGLPDGVVPNPVVNVEMTGEQLVYGLAVALYYGETPQVSDGNFLCYDGNSLQYMLVGGAPVLPDPAAKYQVATDLIVVQIVNKAFALQFPWIPPIAIPGDFDPALSQFAVLMQYAAGRALSMPATPRVLDTTHCWDP